MNSDAYSEVAGTRDHLRAVIVLPWLAGCDKLPKATDYIGNKEEPKAAPVPAPSRSSSDEAGRLHPRLRSKLAGTEEVLGEFNKTKPEDRTDGQLAESPRWKMGSTRSRP